MKTQIKHITSIQTGLFAKPSGIGELVYLQSKHFDENGQLRANLHPDLPKDTITDKHHLKHGDVLFAAKGTKNFATVFENHNPASVASTSFFVLRPTSNKVLPHFLAWFLNNPSTLSILKGQAMGTSIPSISKHVLENLEISLPSIENQTLIVEVSKLRSREIKLKQQIEILRGKQIQNIINSKIK